MSKLEEVVCYLMKDFFVEKTVEVENVELTKMMAVFLKIKLLT